jgi:hypothetical protein
MNIYVCCSVNPNIIKEKKKGMSKYTLFFSLLSCSYSSWLCRLNLLFYYRIYSLFTVSPFSLCPYKYTHLYKGGRQKRKFMLYFSINSIYLFCRCYLAQWMGTVRDKARCNSNPTIQKHPNLLRVMALWDYVTRSQISSLCRPIDRWRNTAYTLV